ncbi:MAG: hypothetical protein HUU54_08355 [Ignavibacteriaceae bacterium]|nr:hypothetical protein [Ignavibacteriaceae bacterium]
MRFLVVFYLSLNILLPLHATPSGGDKDLSSVINSIHQRHQEEEARKKSLLRYSYERRSDVKEMDEDGKLEKQHKSLQRVYHLNLKESRTETISSSKFEDGKWADVPKKEKDEKKDHKDRKVRFDFLGMFSPESRKEYNFELVQQNDEQIVVSVKPKEAATEKFKGKFWFSAKDYSMMKAELQPSEFRTGLKSMNTYIEMKQYNGVSFPAKVVNKIHVKVFLIYSGKIDQNLVFENYKFGIDEKTFSEAYSKLK